MREILFRGKRIEDGEWIYGFYWYDKLGNRHMIQAIEFDRFGWNQEVIPETVGQDTGLKDKNGKKIFEGDVLHWDLYWGWYVGYENGSFRRIPLNNVQRINWKHHTVHQEELDTWEVIGNIHDNPSLISDGED